ncbi:MAG: DNA mismatch repair protein MutS [Alphaproteobacteria bacterium]|nr:DNA mismatch repair protein MutS [Alphaproteobacteria bacterium]MBV9692521.1 DNA mismatch repair protein MutS [Alphaproteobacteria bacterium]
MNEHVLAGEGEATPLMAQYLAIKAGHADYLLFYRMGDFYELFFDDAVKAAAALDIALTKRGKHLERDIPMCGVPVHAADAYLEKLIRKGFRVAVCEQVEDPLEAKKRGAKSVVRREVVRLVTPGTLTEDTLLDPRGANILAGLGRAAGAFALACADISSGQFRVGTIEAQDLAAELARIDAKEVLVPDTLLGEAGLAEVLKALGPALSPLPAVKFESQAGERALKNFYGVTALDGFGSFSRAELSAAGALIAYLELTQKSRLPALSPLMREAPAAHMSIDAATRRNLELTQTLSGERRGSLLACIDGTLTASGARELAQRLAAPLTDPDAIALRHDGVAILLAREDLRAALRQELRQAPDMARALARLSVGRGGPRDLAALRDGIRVARLIREKLRLDGEGASGELRQAHAALAEGIGALSQLANMLDSLLVPEPPYFARDGAFIAAGRHAPLDEARQLRDESRRVVAGLEARYRQASGVPLKIKHNGVLGYFIEAAPQHADTLMAEPARALFRHRQTMAGAVRFSTDELAGLASRIAEAAEQALALELVLFDEMAAEAQRTSLDIGRIAQAMAVLDVAAASAEIARTRRYVRPKIDAGSSFHIARGRHPVVEQALAQTHGGSFVANDCDLSAARGRLWLVTGPNMAGKSTFLRQNALIAILAQAGFYVPADAAHIGVVDKLFSRVGAGDDLAAGRSTFMVEMVETAAILNQATEKSLVILDEIGRGTATYDGLAIAWSAVEHLHETNKSRALFATHYHEMTALAGRLASLACVTMRVREWNDTIVFLHEVAPGVADRSYGIHVAKLAGLPAAVVARAKEVLAALEEGREGHKPLARIDDLPLFAASPLKRQPPAGALAEALHAVSPDTLSPREALELVYRLKALLARSPE